MNHSDPPPSASFLKFSHTKPLLSNKIMCYGSGHDPAKLEPPRLYTPLYTPAKHPPTLSLKPEASHLFCHADLVSQEVRVPSPRRQEGSAIFLVCCFSLSPWLFLEALSLEFTRVALIFHGSWLFKFSGNRQSAKHEIGWREIPFPSI